ncbi:hypothetical protein JYU34_009183 [Plutella xylostella]|uniref:Uncharacterized protein n=1 Tax=Plutella xylostella TaxID=51655 RepID=A0ABQ7QNA4_PLUXY|nr:hypothetical protein JYU34_009183 [Plutella xylostella]
MNSMLARCLLVVVLAGRWGPGAAAGAARGARGALPLFLDYMAMHSLDRAIIYSCQNKLGIIH